MRELKLCPENVVRVGWCWIGIQRWLPRHPQWIGQRGANDGGRHAGAGRLRSQRLHVWDNYNVGSVSFWSRVADSSSGGSRYRQPMPEETPAILSTSHHAGYKLAMETIWKPNTFGGEWGVGKPFYKWAKGPHVPWLHHREAQVIPLGSRTFTLTCQTPEEAVLAGGSCGN